MPRWRRQDGTVRCIEESGGSALRSLRVRLTEDEIENPMID